VPSTQKTNSRYRSTQTIRRRDRGDRRRPGRSVRCSPKRGRLGSLQPVSCGRVTRRLRHKANVRRQCRSWPQSRLSEPPCHAVSPTRGRPRSMDCGQRRIQREGRSERAFHRDLRPMVSARWDTQRFRIRRHEGCALGHCLETGLFFLDSARPKDIEARSACQSFVFISGPQESLNSDLAFIRHDGRRRACSRCLERGHFFWPKPKEGVVTILLAQLDYMLNHPCECLPL
jgi:hypothetical protein